MRQFVALNREMKDDYHYNEAIKTLRTNTVLRKRHQDNHADQFPA